MNKIKAEGFFLMLAWVAGAIGLWAIVMVLLANGKVLEYRLSQDEHKNLSIEKVVDWREDEDIDLDRNVSYWDAIRMVDSLNKTIRR